MKTIYFINLKFNAVLLALSVFGISFAQPAFTSADMPNIGDSDTVIIFPINNLQHDLDTETGNGFVWDFTELPVNTYSMFVNVDSYQEKQYDMSENFPETSIERFTIGSNSSKLGYYEYRNDTLLMYKYGAPSAIAWFPPIALMAFPLNFNQSSDITSDFYYGVLKTGERRAIATYDGFGTLKMPNNKTYSNVFRVKTVERDTTFVTEGSITYVTYSWYQQGGNIPLLQLKYGNSPGNYSVYASAGKGANTGTKELVELAGISLYPNPAQNKLNLKLLHPEEIIELSIISPLGQRIKVFHSLPENIDVSDLPMGLYFLQLKSKNEHTSQTFIKH